LITLPTTNHQLFALANPNWASYDVRAGGLLVGCGMAFLPRLSLSGKSFSGLVLLGLAGYAVSIAYFSDNVSESATVLCTALIVKCLWNFNPAEKNFIYSLFSNRLFTILGRCSYEIYLIHYPLVLVTIWELQRHAVSTTTTRELLPVVGIVSILLAFALSNLSANMVNRLRVNLQ
jgi:peptidoglycan/LPS O-acetylase OafA/YrhL